MLQLRGLVITDRWDERVDLMRQHKRRSHLADWHWTPQPMSSKIELGTQASKNTA